MNKSFTVAAIGYPSIDRIIKINSPIEVGKTSIILNDDNSNPCFGGCNVNICYALSKLNVESRAIMNVGNDFESSGYKQFLEYDGVNLEYVTGIKERATSNSYLIEDLDGNHITLFNIGAMHDVFINRDYEDIVRDVNLGIIAVGNVNDNMAFTKALIKAGKEIAFSMKFDVNAFPENELKFFLQNSTYIFMNESESECIVKYQHLSDITDLLNINTKCLIITKGKFGSEIIFRENDEIQKINVPIAKEKVKIDSIGVGDAYVAGYIYGLSKRCNCVQCGQYGSTVASFILEGKGSLTTVPTCKQLEKRFNENYK